MLMDYIVPSLHIEVATGMDDEVAFEELVAQLIQLEEVRFIVEFH